MYTIFRRTEDGELVKMATLASLGSAEKVLQRFKELWPADEYELHESGSDSSETSRS